MVPRDSFTYSSPPYESTVGKRVRDSEFGQPRSDTVSPNRLNFDKEEGIVFTDVNVTKLKELEIRPILTQHFESR